MENWTTKRVSTFQSPMALQIWFPLSNHNHNLSKHRHGYGPTLSSPTHRTRTIFSISLPKPSLLSTQQHNPVPESTHNVNDTHKDSFCLSKRNLNLAILVLFSYGFFPNMSKSILAEELQLQRYVDTKEGFTLLTPSSWIKVHTLLSIDFVLAYKPLSVMLFVCIIEVSFGWIGW